MTRRKNWMAMVAMFATASLVACGGGDAGETETGTEGDDATTTPAPTTQQPQQMAAGPAPEGATDQMVTQGQQIFSGKGNCYTCHGPQAQGTPLAPNLTDGEWLNIEEPSWDNLQQVVRNGVPTPEQHPGAMPPMGGAQLSDQEVQSVAAYVYAISNQGGSAGGM